MPFTAGVKETERVLRPIKTKHAHYRLSIIICILLLLTSCQNAESGSTLSRANGHSDNLTGFIATAAKKAEAKGDHAAAARNYRTLYNEQEPDADVALGLARNMRKSGNSEAAIPLLKKATDKFPDNEPLTVELGKLYVASKKPDKAMKVLEKALNDNPDNWDVMNSYALAMDQVGKHDKAQRMYERAEAISPDNPVILNNHALSAALSGNLTDARILIAKAAALPSADNRIHNNMSMVEKLKQPSSDDGSK